MKRLTYYLVIGTTLLMINACAPVYRPTSLNIPMFESADELHIAVHTGNSGYDLQTAYSIDDQFGIMVNASYQNRSEDSLEIRKHTFAEAGFGYYRNLSEHTVFETYLGFGAGHSEAVDIAFGSDSFSAEGNFTKFFLQPSISYRAESYQLGFATRFSYVNFSTYTDNFLINPNPTALSSLFIEPTIYGSVGNANWRFIMQFGLSMKQSETDFNHGSVITNIGVRYIIPQFGSR